MRFKNFSGDSIEFPVAKGWRHPNGAILITEKFIMEPGEVTTDFDADDPIVQIMLKVHPELRPYVTPTIWEWIRKPAF
jgi:hypothetical protein